MIRYLIALFLLPVILSSQVPGPQKTPANANPAPLPFLWLKLNEGGAATTAIDSSPYHHDFAWAGTRYCSGSYYGAGDGQTYAGCFNFNNAALFGTLVPPPGSTQLTLSFWAMVNEVIGSNALFLFSQFTPPNFGTAIEWNYSGGAGTGPTLFVPVLGGNVTAQRAAFVATPGTWYHYCGTYDQAAQTASIFINGVLSSTNSVGATMFTPQVQTTQIAFASNGQSSTGNTGFIQNVKYFNYIQSSISCPALYALGPAN